MLSQYSTAWREYNSRVAKEDPLGACFSLLGEPTSAVESTNRTMSYDWIKGDVTYTHITFEGGQSRVSRVNARTVGYSEWWCFEEGEKLLQLLLRSS